VSTLLVLSCCVILYLCRTASYMADGVAHKAPMMLNVYKRFGYCIIPLHIVLSNYKVRLHDCIVKCIVTFCIVSFWQSSYAVVSV
jgi:hypothetical protein